MIGLYGVRYNSRYRSIADLIEPDSSVLELCCGPGVLCRRYLNRKRVQYVGLDINHAFVDSLKRKGIDARRFDVQSDTELPGADSVIMQASLYHFLPDPWPILNRMIKAASRQVIIAEPVRNLANSENSLVAYLAKRFTDPGNGSQAKRFTEVSLDDLFSITPDGCEFSAFGLGERERIYVIRKGVSSSTAPE
jgi:trans-aconitate methyltransferase